MLRKPRATWKRCVVFRFVRHQTSANDSFFAIADSAFATGMEFACMLAVQERGTSRGSATGYPFSLPLYPGFAGPRNNAMTTTDIGILLIVLCVLLWAIMAALHRHTVQLKALQAQLDELLDASQPKRPRPTEADVLGRNDHGEPRAVHASGEKRA
jgi:hypothetical protein